MLDRLLMGLTLLVRESSRVICTYLQMGFWDFELIFLCVVKVICVHSGSEIILHKDYWFVVLSLMSARLD